MLNERVPTLASIPVRVSDGWMHSHSLASAAQWRTHWHILYYSLGLQQWSSRRRLTLPEELTPSLKALCHYSSI